MASIKKNFFYNALYNLTTVIFPLITAPYVARVLDPDGIGLANFANTYSGYFAMIAGLGCYFYSLREISKRRDSIRERQEFVSEMMTLLGINTLILSLLFIITILTIPQLSHNKLIFLIAGFSLYLFPLKIDWYYAGMEKFGHLTGRNITLRILTIIALFLFVKTKSDLYIYVILSVISSMGSIFWNLLILIKEGIKPKIKISGIRKHYKPMLLLFSSTVAISIYTMLDTLMLGFMSDYTQTGFYNSATHISRALLSIVTSMSAVAVPRVAYYMKNKDYDKINSLLQKSFGIAAFLAIPMTIGLSCIAPTFVPLFLGESFQGAIIPMIFMSCIITAIAFNNITGMQILLGLGEDKRYLQCMIIGAAANLMLNSFAIPLWGAMGASGSSVIAEFIIVITTTIAVKKYTAIRIPNIWYDIFKSLIPSLFFIPISLFFYNLLHGWWIIIATALSCMLLYAISQKLLHSTGYLLIQPIIKNKLHINI